MNYYGNNNIYAFVNGVEGAKAYQVQPNQTVMLIDSENSYLYLKQANGIGQSTLQYFKLEQIDENQFNAKKEYITREELTKILEEMRNNG